MTVELNHTIVPSRDKHRSATFLAGILGLETSPPFARFVPLALGNHVTLDYLDVAEPQPQHYAFMVDDETFDADFARITAAGIAYHAEPNGDRPGEIYHRRGGRGVYFPDPDGHSMEILTPPAALPAP
ncbi:MAG: VOC family protein [Acidimicrobiales bacterium]